MIVISNLARNHRHQLLAMVFAFLLAPILNAEFESNDGFEKVRVRTVSGSSIRATILGIDESGNIDCGDPSKSLHIASIIALTTDRTPVVKSDAIEIELKGGGTVRAENIELVAEAVELSGSVVKELPLAAIRSIIWRRNPTVAQALKEPSRESDVVVVQTANGARSVTGIVESINQTHVEIAYKGESRPISLEKIDAIVAADIPWDKPAGVDTTIVTIDGSRVDGSIKKFEAGLLVFAIGPEFQIPFSAEQVCEIIVRSDRIGYLSDLSPVRFESQSQFAPDRPWQRDKSLLGNPLRLVYRSTGRQLEFEKGIGTRSFTNLVFANSGGFTHLRAVVGIDSETSGLGDCEVVVEGDGIRLWSKRVRASDDPEPITIDIRGLNEISLIVLPGENFDLADHLNWAAARFTKSD